MKLYDVKSERIKIPAFVGMTQLVLLTFVLFLSSCQKYLDIKDGNYNNRPITNITDAQKLMDDYTGMNTNYQWQNLGSSDDYYIGTNVYASYRPGDKNIYTWGSDATLIRSGEWNNAYKKIYQANVVLENLDKIKSTGDLTSWNNLKGVALFFRAYALWDLAQVYCKPYGSTSAQDLGLPLRTSSDISDLFARATVKETYDFIIKDLNESLGIINTTAPAATRPDKAAVNAMLARVYLSMEDYTNALTSSDAVITLAKVKAAVGQELLDYNSSTIDQTSETPFARLNVEVLFHSMMASSTLLDPGYDSYPGARINPVLYNSYDVNDLRKVIFFKENTEDFAGTYRFTGNYEPAFSAELFNGLTTAEMYLIRAECYARVNNTALALNDLNTLLVKRWKTGTYTPMTNTDPATNTADKVLAKVLEERRKELVMRGQRWTDLRRLNKDSRFKMDIDRKEDGDSGAVLATLPANDPRYTLLLSQDVINNGGYPQNIR